MKILEKLIVAAELVVLAVWAWNYVSSRYSLVPIAQPVISPTQQPSVPPAQTQTPHPAASTKTYTNSKLSFSITYPADMASSSVNYTGYLPLTKNPLASFVLSSSTYEGTNLKEAGVYVGASYQPKAITSCGLALQGETALGTQTINGAVFNVFSSNDAGAGNLYESKIYRRLENGWCVEVVELLHSANIGNYTPGTVMQFDKSHFQGLLDAVVRTYRSIPTGV